MKHSVLLLVGSILGAFVLAMEGAEAWQSAFSVDQKKFISTGSNPYFNLTPGYRLIYKNGNDADTTTVLSVTKRIDGVETSAIEKTLSDHKWYAPGVGLVKDGEMVLVQSGKN
jgi:hypothetical protein